MGEILPINYYEDVKDLFLNLYLIGYENEGESIIISVTSSNPEKRLFYIGIVDSYKSGDINLTKEVLEHIFERYELKKEKRKINFLCWTHPHDDHTKGMDDIIKQYCNNKTLIALPCIFYMDSLLTDESKKALEAIKAISFNRKNVKNRGRLELLSNNNDLQKLNIGIGRNKHEMLIEYYGPVSYTHLTLPTKA